MLYFHIILYVPVNRYKFKTCNISCNEVVIYRMKHRYSFQDLMPYCLVHDIITKD